jgi:hypothetical protein
VRQSHLRAALLLALALVLSLMPLHAGATEDSGADGVTYVTEDGVTMTDNVTPVAHLDFIGGSEIDVSADGRYLYAGQANLDEETQRQTVTEGHDGGLRIIDLEGEVDPETGERVGQYEQVAYLNCPGTDNYVRTVDPAIFDGEFAEREYVAIAHHGNLCTGEALLEGAAEGRYPTAAGYGAQNGVMIVDVTDKANPEIAGVVGHYSAHTVMPHPTRPWLYILPGGLPTNGSNVPARRIGPTAIVDISDPTDPVYVNSYQHNQSGCHDLGFSADGDYAFCAGFQEVQVWDVAGDKITNPAVVGRIVNPAIQFAHNVVVSPSGQYIAINDEAFGFHTCTGEAADLYGSLWIYDISDPTFPTLAGRVHPPGHHDGQGWGTLYDVNNPGSGETVVNGWADSWCAAHNYNWVPGNDDVIIASWFGGGITAHDISDLMSPELLAHYMPHDGTAWSGHYYSGYMVTNDMQRGVEILDVPDVRALDPTLDEDLPHLGSDGRAHGEDRARAQGDNRDDNGKKRSASAASASTSSASTLFSAPRVDMSSVLIPDVLPPRPVAPRDAQGGGFCVLPGGPRL